MKTTSLESYISCVWWIIGARCWYASLNLYNINNAYKPKINISATFDQVIFFLSKMGDIYHLNLYTPPPLNWILRTGFDFEYVYIHVYTIQAQVTICCSFVGFFSSKHTTKFTTDSHWRLTTRNYLLSNKRNLRKGRKGRKRKPEIRVSQAWPTCSVWWVFPIRCLRL